MSKETIVFIGGILLTIIPFLGIPSAWRTYAIVAIGVILIFIGYSLRRAAYLTTVQTQTGERVTDSFVETTDTLFTKSELQ
jgi:hypothetical protein